VNCVVVLVDKSDVLKSLFKVKRHGFEDEQAKLERYSRYFKKIDNLEYDLIVELYDKCSENPSIDVGVQSLVERLHGVVVGDGIE
jgi:hypothetical protein